MNYADLVVLSKRDIVTERLDINDASLFHDPESRVRLVQDGLIEKNGTLTPEGKALTEKLDEMEISLRKGMPFEKRTRRDEPLEYSSIRPWYMGKAFETDVFSNGEIMVVGKPHKLMNAIRGPSAIRATFHLILNKLASKKNMKQMFPHTFQAERLGGLELIWLADDPQKMFIPLQARYFDYIMDRFPRATFWGTSPSEAVTVKVRNKGVKNWVVGAVMPFIVETLVPFPTKRESWTHEEAMAKEGMPDT